MISEGPDSVICLEITLSSTDVFLRHAYQTHRIVFHHLFENLFYKEISEAFDGAREPSCSHTPLWIYFCP